MGATGTLWGHGKAFQRNMGHGHTVVAHIAEELCLPQFWEEICRGAEPVGCVQCHYLKNQTCFLSIGICGPSEERKVVSGRRVSELETKTLKKVTNKK